MDIILPLGMSALCPPTPLPAYSVVRDWVSFGAALGDTL
jgi:hypothetical protein